MHSLILFASGKGSNVQAIIDYFRDNSQVNVSLIICNKANAGVLDIAQKEGVAYLLISKADFQEEAFVDKLQSYNPSLLVLAGFLWKIPDTVTMAFKGRIINIHPSLLPHFGGKGMYGAYVHEAVLAARHKESGITIHEVNEVYDDGVMLLQARCQVTENDTPDSLAEKIHQLEHFYFPRCIEFLLSRQ